MKLHSSVVMEFVEVSPLVAEICSSCYYIFNLQENYLKKNPPHNITKLYTSVQR